MFIFANEIARLFSFSSSYHIAWVFHVLIDNFCLTSRRKYPNVLLLGTKILLLLFAYLNQLISYCLFNPDNSRGRKVMPSC